jgi:hypothetical protein
MLLAPYKKELWFLNDKGTIHAIINIAVFERAIQTGKRDSSTVLIEALMYISVNSILEKKKSLYIKHPMMVINAER